MHVDILFDNEIQSLLCMWESDKIEGEIKNNFRKQKEKKNVDWISYLVLL